MAEETRTKRDPHYADVNRAASSRIAFSMRMAWEWLKRYEPEIAAAIREEGYRRWPLVGGRAKVVDYSFLNGLTRKKLPFQEEKQDP